MSQHSEEWSWSLYTALTRYGRAIFGTYSDQLCQLNQPVAWRLVPPQKRFLYKTAYGLLRWQRRRRRWQGAGGGKGQAQVDGESYTVLGPHGHLFEPVGSPKDGYLSLEQEGWSGVSTVVPLSSSGPQRWQWLKAAGGQSSSWRVNVPGTNRPKRHEFKEMESFTINHLKVLTQRALFEPQESGQISQTGHQLIYRGK